MGLLGEVDGALGMALDTRGLVSLMTGEASLHAGTVGLRISFVMHNIIMTDGTLPPGQLHVKFMGNGDFHHVILESLDIALLYFPMTPQAVCIRSFGVRLIITRNPLFMPGMTLRTVDSGVDQGLLNKGNLSLPVMAGQTVSGIGGGKVCQADKGDSAEDHQRRDDNE